jgi:hypothetical protein
MEVIYPMETKSKITKRTKIKKARDAKEYDMMLFDFIEKEFKKESEQHEERQ